MPSGYLQSWVRRSNAPPQPDPPEEPAFPPVAVYPSPNLARLLGFLSQRSGCTILDMGLLCPNNVAYFSERGGKLYLNCPYEDLAQYWQTRQACEAKDLTHPLQGFSYPTASLDAVLAWDVFDFLESNILSRVLERMAQAMKPGGLLLAYFGSPEPPSPAAPSRFRILDERQVQMEPQTTPLLPAWGYSNVQIMRFFEDWEVLNSALLRDQRREVLARVSS